MQTIAKQHFMQRTRTLWTATILKYTLEHSWPSTSTIRCRRYSRLQRYEVATVWRKEKSTEQATWLHKLFRVTFAIAAIDVLIQPRSGM